MEGQIYMVTIQKILFVCTDNTCRSIMAEAVMKSVCKDRKIEIASRGLVVLFPEPLNPKAVAVLKGNLLTPEKSSSEALEASDVNEHTLILTMTSREAEMVKERFPGPAPVYPLGEFAGKPGNIEEPHGGTLAEYGACYEYVDLLVKLAAERLFKSGEQEQKELQARGMRDGRFE